MGYDSDALTTAGLIIGLLERCCTVVFPVAEVSLYSCIITYS